MIIFSSLYKHGDLCTSSGFYPREVSVFVCQCAELRPVSPPPSLYGNKSSGLATRC